MKKKIQKIQLNDPLMDFIIAPNLLNQYKYKIPYIIRLLNKQQKVVFLGINHSNNYKAPHFKKIESFLEELKKNHSKKEIILITEGILPTKNLPKKEMVKKYREAGLLTYLANKEKISIYSCDTTFKKTANLIIKEKKFNKIDVALWIFLNVLNQFLNNSNPLLLADIKEINKIISNAKKMLKINIPVNILIKKFRKRLINITNENLIPEKLQDLTKLKIRKKNSKKPPRPVYK